MPKPNSPTLAYAYLSAAYDSSVKVKKPLHVLKPIIFRAFVAPPKKALNRVLLSSRISELFGIEIPLNVLTYILASMVNEDKTLIRWAGAAKRGIADTEYVVESPK